MEAKKIVKNHADGNYCLLIPVYYEYENKPAWRIARRGTLLEVQSAFDLFPEYLMASNDENLKNRQNKRQEFLFLLEIGKKKEAEKIQRQYRL